MIAPIKREGGMIGAIAGDVIGSTYEFHPNKTIDFLLFTRWSKFTNDIRPEYHFDETCQGSVSESIIAFLESNSYENCIRLAVSPGGDADTQAFYRDIPIEIFNKTSALLTQDMRETLTTFRDRFGW